MPPAILALATRGRYYLRCTDDGIDAPMYDEYGNTDKTGEHVLPAGR